MSVKALSGWYSLVGVLAFERMITIENRENPIVMVVKQSNTVLASTLPLFIVSKSPQKHRASNTTMKNAAPELNGRPRVFTKNRSV